MTLPHIWVLPPSFAFIGGIGTTELIVVLVVALIVLGPAKLPEVAKSIGKGMRELRRASNDLRDEVYDEVGDVKETFEDVRREAESGPPEDSGGAESAPKTKEDSPPPRSAASGVGAMPESGSAPADPPPSDDRSDTEDVESGPARPAPSDGADGSGERGR